MERFYRKGQRVRLERFYLQTPCVTEEVIGYVSYDVPCTAEFIPVEIGRVVETPYFVAGTSSVLAYSGLKPEIRNVPRILSRVPHYRIKSN